MTPARVLADDITGALDAGACFADGEPLRVAWREPFPDEASFVIDTESRDMPPEEAKERVLREMPRLVAGDVPFKKIDSLLRGNTIPEIAACVESGCFATIVLAPAFPAQHRITRDGRQFARNTDNETWQPVGPPLMGAIAAHASSVRRVLVNGEASGEGIFVCDAESHADLASLPRRLAQVERPILWCGTAGLARSWRQTEGASAAPRGRGILVIIGSDHPLAIAQVQMLAAGEGELTPLKTADECVAVSSAVADRLAAGRTVVVKLRRAPEHDGRQRLAESVRRLLDGVRAPDVFVASGGDTLMALLQAVGATHVLVEGEIAPGLPRARICGGAWDGCAFVSKAGGFGRRETLRDLVRSMREEPSP